MKKILTIMFFLVVSYYNANSQAIYYNYDDAGNRINKVSFVFPSLNFKFFNATNSTNLFDSNYYYIRVGVVNGINSLVLNSVDSNGIPIDDTVLQWNKSTSAVKVTLYINHLTDTNKYLVIDVSNTLYKSGIFWWWTSYQTLSAGPTPLADNDNIKLTYTIH